MPTATGLPDYVEAWRQSILRRGGRQTQRIPAGGVAPVLSAAFGTPPHVVYEDAPAAVQESYRRWESGSDPNWSPSVWQMVKDAANPSTTLTDMTRGGTAMTSAAKEAISTAVTRAIPQPPSAATLQSTAIKLILIGGAFYLLAQLGRAAISRREA